MKKLFFATVTALAMCNVSFAQDDLFDEDESPRAVSEQPAQAQAPVAQFDTPAAAPVEAAPSSDKGFLGIGMGFEAEFKRIELKIRINDEMMATAILGMYHHGETSLTLSKPGKASIDQDLKDGYTEFSLGAGFDYFIATPILPISVGGEFIFAYGGEKEAFSAMNAAETATQGLDLSEISEIMEDDASSSVDLEGNNAASCKFSSSDILINFMFGVHAPITKGFTLTGKAGLGLDINMSEFTNIEQTKIEFSRFDIGFKAGVYASWFFM